MKARLLNKSRGQKTFVVVFDAGDEAMAGLTDFARQHDVSAAHFTAIGALSGATLAFFDVAQKEYRKMAVSEQVEVLSLAGNVALHDGKPKVHAHVVLGKADGTAHGGHLVEGHVRPTLEVVLIESPRHLRRRFDDSTGLALLDVEARGA